MDEFIAVVRLRPPTRGGPLAGLAAAVLACQHSLPGVREAIADARDRAIQVRFDRSKTTVADIVRCVEDTGLAVSSVAQSKVDLRLQAATA